MKYMSEREDLCLLSSSTNKRIIPELFVLTLQIDVDCTSYFDTEVFQHVPLVDSDVLDVTVPQMTRGSKQLGSHRECFIVIL